MTAPDVSARSITDLMSLERRVALVTGGAQGIGLAIAARLSEAGASVMLADRQRDLAEQSAAKLGAAGRTASAVALDVRSDASALEAVAATLERFGRIDILINNAGLMPPPSPLGEVDSDELASVMDVNVAGVVRMTRAVIPALVEQGSGVIVNLASTASFRVPNPGTVVYTSSKHAVNAVTKASALELGPLGIRVLDVAPTMVDTPGIRKLRELSAERAAARGETVALGRPEAFAKLPLGRGNVPDDVARVVLFCVSDMAAMMTGCTVAIDGGSMIR
jgi:NAD(P)-dependent dehydrogenase (short-subunit alcohol dehydrogenase family)